MLDFHKYVAVGNDFIILNNWSMRLVLSKSQIQKMCDRRFGIGADGILLLEPESTADFRMKYFNSDGSRGEMCGNGARALTRYAESQRRAEGRGIFLADDGYHKYHIHRNSIDVEILVNDQLKKSTIPHEACRTINTGVPHLLVPVSNVSSEKLDPLGLSMNIHSAFPEGINVNIMERVEELVHVRTWERGVNEETLACGTGATAAAIFAHEEWNMPWPISLKFKGGDLKVDNRRNHYWLSGSAKLVFIGQLPLP